MFQSVFELSSAILHFARINLILTFCLGQNTKFCFHIFVCLFVSIFLSALYFLHKQGCGLTYIYMSPLLNPMHYLLPHSLSQSFSTSARPWAKSLWPGLTLTNNNPFHCWAWALGAVLCLITGLPWFYYFSFHFSATCYFLFSITDYIHDFCHWIEHESL